MTEVFVPSEMGELRQLLVDHPNAVPYAGGTDLLVRIRSGLLKPEVLVCLERIEALKGVVDHKDETFIGPCTTHTDLLREPLILRDFPALAGAIKVLGSPLIRNSATIGGNIITASPAADTLPPLYLLGAELELWNDNGARRTTMTEFIKGPGRTTLRKGEILTGIWIPRKPGFTVSHYEKVGRRKALAIGIVSLAALMRLSESGIIEEAWFAWGSVGPTIVIAREVEQAVVGLPLEMETLQMAATLAEKAVRPIDDIRAGAAYRRKVAGRLLLRLLQYRGNPDTVQPSPGAGNLLI